LFNSLVDELARGVTFVHLGDDSDYVKLMMRNGIESFDFVNRATGATISVDPILGDHLRIEVN
jgi:hypothetical protein